MISIQRFLIIIILSVVCLTNFVAALQGYRDSLESVDRIEEQQLQEKAHALGELIKQKSEIPEKLFGSDTLYQIWGEKGLKRKSSNAPQRSLIMMSQVGFHFGNFDGDQWLVYQTEKLDDQSKIVVATKHRVYSSLTEEVLIRTILPIIWVLPIVGVLVWGIVYLGLKPLRRLARDLDLRSANDFSSISNLRYSSELLPIVNALNGLFSRLDSAFEREKRFSADAAHELRTPLSALKINLHNLARTKNEELLESLGRTADRMEHSIEQLLTLHKVSMDSEASDFQSINLQQLAQEVIVDVYEQVDLRSQEIELRGVETFIQGNSSSIEILIRNLIDNASKYTPAGGFIRVTVCSEENQPVLRIEDSGPGVPDGELSRILDRFYRVGGDRSSSNVRGSGLGLSIVSDIVKTHRAKITLSNVSDLGGLSVKVTFPELEMLGQLAK